MAKIAKPRQTQLWQNAEYRQRQIEALQHGKKTATFKKNQSIAQKRRFMNPREREKMATILRNLPRAKGHDAGGWKGGVSTDNEKQRKCTQFKLWRKSVFSRDNWTCQRCLNRGGILHPHHIKPFFKYPELRFKIENGLTLCFNCHKIEHAGNKSHFEG